MYVRINTAVGWIEWSYYNVVEKSYYYILRFSLNLKILKIKLLFFTSLILNTICTKSSILSLFIVYCYKVYKNSGSKWLYVYLNTVAAPDIFLWEAARRHNLYPIGNTIWIKLSINLFIDHHDTNNLQDWLLICY